MNDGSPRDPCDSLFAGVDFASSCEGLYKRGGALGVPVHDNKELATLCIP